MASNPADNHTALLLESEGLSLLLDTGPTIMRQLERVGRTAGDPTHVFLSHQHGDHMLGLPMLLLNRVLFWPDRTLWVMAEASVLELAQQVTQIVFPDLKREMASTIRFVALQSRQAGALPGAGNVHYRLAQGRHSVPSWGIRLELADAVVVYSSDTGRSDEIAALAEGATMLVHEAFFLAPPEQPFENHSVTREVAALAERAKVRTLALVHRQAPGREAESAYCTAAESAFSGGVLVPQAGECVQL